MSCNLVSLSLWSSLSVVLIYSSARASLSLLVDCYISFCWRVSWSCLLYWVRKSRDWRRAVLWARRDLS